MPLINLVSTLILVGAAVWLTNRNAPMASGIKRILLSFAFFLCFSWQAFSATPLWLSTSGTKIVDSNGATVVLRGVNLGGAYEIEPWMSSFNLSSPTAGMPVIQDESTLWNVLTQRFGTAETQQLQQTWRTSWLSPTDIAGLAAMGVTVVRIPFFYQMLQADSNPGQLIPAGVALLDSIVAACAQAGIYAILDLHGAPGGQSANFTTGQAGLNQLFTSTAYQEQTIQLWELIAAHYQNHPEVAGYDLINEPLGAPDGPTLVNLYRQIYSGIRAVDPRHIIFMQDAYKGLTIFPPPAQNGLTNVAFSLHVYHLLATSASDFQDDIMTTFPQYQRELASLNAPLWIGEFSTEGIFLSRSQAMALLPLYTSTFNDLGWSWTPWNFKITDPVNGTLKIWGLYTNSTPWNQPDPYNDSFSTLQQKFGNYVTSNLPIQTDFQTELKAGLSGGTTPVISAVVNSATFGPATASATWTTIMGTNLSQTTRQWEASDFNGDLLPTSLSGVSVLIDGVPAYVAYISPTQINVLLPDDSTTGTVSVQVMNSAGSASSTLQKQTFAPGFFTLANNYVSAVHANGTLIGPVGLYPNSSPAQPGEEILLFGTGFGPTNPPTPTGQLVSQPAPAANQITVSVGGVQVTPLFAGIVESGLYQFNLIIPNVASGDEPVIATVGGQNTQSSLNINIQ